MNDSEPLSLVREYVQRDALGQRLRSNPWFDSVITEPEHEPGYDSFTAIIDHRERLDKIDNDRVRVAVTYRIAGSIRQLIEHDRTVGERFVPKRDSQTVFFVVLRTPNGWRIQSPQMDQHVLVAALLSLPRIRFSPTDREALKALAQVRP